MECNVERELRERLVNFRRIWVHYTRLGSLCVTLFPAEPHSQYRIVTRQKLGDRIWRRTKTTDENGNETVLKELDVDLIERIVREDLAL
jgi:hypothetical protein